MFNNREKNQGAHLALSGIRNYHRVPEAYAQGIREAPPIHNNACIAIRSGYHLRLSRGMNGRSSGPT
jgi:hypothetical protein